MLVIIMNTLAPERGTKGGYEPSTSKIKASVDKYTY